MPMIVLQGAIPLGCCYANEVVGVELKVASSAQFNVQIIINITFTNQCGECPFWQTVLTLKVATGGGGRTRACVRACFTMAEIGPPLLLLLNKQGISLCRK